MHSCLKYPTPIYNAQFILIFFIPSSKPLVCLFSTLFKKNLLTFIYLVHSVLPGTAILHLLECLSKDSYVDPWVTTLSRQLERQLAPHHDEPLCTEDCSQKLKGLIEGVVGCSEKGGWTQCFTDHIVKSESQVVYDVSEVRTQKKRRVSFVHLEDADGDETRQQRKRTKWTIWDDKIVELEDDGVKNDAWKGSEGAAPAPSPAPNSPQGNLPENLTVNKEGAFSANIQKKKKKLVAK